MKKLQIFCQLFSVCALSLASWVFGIFIKIWLALPANFLGMRGHWSYSFRMTNIWNGNNLEGMKISNLAGMTIIRKKWQYFERNGNITEQMTIIWKEWHKALSWKKNIFFVCLFVCNRGDTVQYHGSLRSRELGQAPMLQDF